MNVFWQRYEVNEQDIFLRNRDLLVFSTYTLRKNAYLSLIYFSREQTQMKKSVCVYLGASTGTDTKFSNLVIRAGEEIATLGLTLVYGGSSCGLMGLLATTVKDCGGEVIGITTRHLLEIEKPLSNLNEFHVVDSMQERKSLMQSIADNFLVMPGGIGTLEEAFETWNAIKLGILNKLIGFLNVEGFFDDLFAFMVSCKNKGFISNKQLNIPLVDMDIRSLLVSMTTMKNQKTTLELDMLSAEVTRRITPAFN